MSARDASEYQEFIIEANDGSRSVDIRLGVVGFQYYEDLFSPTVTAKITVVDTGGTITGADGKKEAIVNGLPIRGGERVSIKVKPNGNPALDFSSKDNYLYVSSIRNILSDNLKEAFILELVSREAIVNETTRIPKKFPKDQKISDTVSKIVKEYLKSDDVEVDETQNKYGFIGNLKRPFDILVWLASKSVPVTKDAMAGFFFYQTQDGFKFKSIDNLISQGVNSPKNDKNPYRHTEAPVDKIDTDDFKILSHIFEKNNDLLKKLRLGTYSSFFTEFNPLTGAYTKPLQGSFNLIDYATKLKNLGGDPEIPNVVSENGFVLGNTPSRIISCVADVGVTDVGISTSQNAAASQYQRQALLRYNLLFMQSMSMIVPVNTNLQVGDVIRCEFPRISGSSDIDRQKSGLYMIKELCHYFDGTQSLTSMRLIRDTFGEFGNQ